MNETISLLMATSILALGGLGLYMFKSSDEENKKGGDNESSLFSSNFWGLNDNENDTNENEQNELDDSLGDENEDYPIKKSKPKSQTKRQKRTFGTRRRY
jgi:hypothetical protein